MMVSVTDRWMDFSEQNAELSKPDDTLRLKKNFWLFWAAGRLSAPAAKRENVSTPSFEREFLLLSSQMGFALNMTESN